MPVWKPQFTYCNELCGVSDILNAPHNTVNECDIFKDGSSIHFYPLTSDMQNVYEDKCNGCNLSGYTNNNYSFGRMIIKDGFRPYNNGSGILTYSCELKQLDEWTISFWGKSYNNPYGVIGFDIASSGYDTYTFSNHNNTWNYEDKDGLVAITNNHPFEPTNIVYSKSSNGILDIYMNTKHILQKTFDNNDFTGIVHFANTPDQSYPNYINFIRIFNRKIDIDDVIKLYNDRYNFLKDDYDTVDILGDGSCIRFFKFDGSGRDYAGGTDANITANGYGYDDIVGHYVDVSEDGNIIQIDEDFVNKNMCITFWYKLVKQPQESTLIRFTSTNGYAYPFKTSGRDIFFEWFGRKTSANNVVIGDNNWRFISFNIVINGGYYDIYIDVDNSGVAKKITFSKFNVMLNYIANNCSCYIGQMRIFNKTLNSHELNIVKYFDRNYQLKGF